MKAYSARIAYGWKISSSLCHLIKYYDSFPPYYLLQLNPLQDGEPFVLQCGGYPFLDI